MKSARLQNLRNQQNLVQALLNSGLGPGGDPLRSRSFAGYAGFADGVHKRLSPWPAHSDCARPLGHADADAAVSLVRRCSLWQPPRPAVPGAHRESAARGGGAASHLGAFV